ncbi:MAG TPA: MBL fold metallo-hydrolase [Candidatus Acidoferrales bacterium]|nr:MBL fold metallo-hydrolase [Candidatus Acidoferrales bacterium]
MVSILKDKKIEDIEIIPCRVNGPRGIVKSFLVLGEERTILVDTGFSDADADLIIDRLEKAGKKHSDLKLVILTHRHGDHVGGLPKLKRILKFTLMAHELDVEGVKKISGADVDQVVKGGEFLPDCGGIRVLHTPGHTPGSISLFLPKTKTLIAGDAVLSAGEHLIPSPHYLCSDPEQAKATVEQLIKMNLGIERVLVGHGDDVYEGGQQKLHRIIEGPRAD